MQLNRMLLTPIAICGSFALFACNGGKSDSASAPSESASTTAAASPAKANSAVPDACQLLTADEIKTATGWVNPTPHDTTMDRSYLSTCNFTDGADASRMMAVNVSVGGPTHVNSEEFAKSVGDNGGMLAQPATPVDGYSVPVIKMDMGATQSMQARTPRAVELTVTTSSADTTLALFPKALARLDTAH